MGRTKPHGCGRSSPEGGGALGAFLILAAGCGEVEARPQLVVFVDTDALLTGQVAIDPTLPADGAMDTLRVDILEADGTVREFRNFAISQPVDWPVSFGIVPTDEGSMKLRLRLFKSTYATAETLQGVPVLEPFPGSSIDRIVELSTSPTTIEGKLVELSFACIGTAPLFGSAPQTCVDGERLLAGIDEGIVDIDPSAPQTTLVGTTPLTSEVSCSGAPSGSICIPGGFAMMGHPDFVGLGELSQDARPLRPVRLSPFGIDETEFTVGRYRQLLVQNPALAEPSTEPGCTWLGRDDPSNDDLPVTCVAKETALAACQASGGNLITEAQWSFVARGRGQGRILPWGDTAPLCCTASHLRVAPAVGEPLVCGNESSVEPVKSHPVTDACNGTGDVSRDGVYDLGGSVTEIMRDQLVDYDGPCWSAPGLPLDPVCTGSDTTGTVVRGGAWSLGSAYLLAPARRNGLGLVSSVGSGFRCSYPVGP